MNIAQIFKLDHVVDKHKNYFRNLKMTSNNKLNDGCHTLEMLQKKNFFEMLG